MITPSMAVREKTPRIVSRLLNTRPLVLVAIAAAVAFEAHTVVDGGWLFPAIFSLVCIGAAIHAMWPHRDSAHS